MQTYNELTDEQAEVLMTKVANGMRIGDARRYAREQWGLNLPLMTLMLLRVAGDAMNDRCRAEHED